MSLILVMNSFVFLSVYGLLFAYFAMMLSVNAARALCGASVWSVMFLAGLSFSGLCAFMATETDGVREPEG